MGDIIISALIGLVGACNNNPKTSKTDCVVIKALAFPLIAPEYTDGALREIVGSIYEEKKIISPGCAQCVCPCGNTSDYDMSRIYDAEENVREAKLQILTELRELAAFVYRNPENTEVDNSFFFKALSYVSYDLDAADLHELLDEAKAMKQKIRRDTE